MNRTKIEYCDFSWNPIKGLCPEACWYCYARRMYHRFRLDDFYEHLEFHATRGDIAKMYRIHPSRIFICSTIEMFHPKVETAWRDKIFYTIEKFPEHTFIILTKRPENIDRPMPDNIYLGVSVTGPDNLWRWFNIDQLQKARIKFISFEPILEPFPKHELGYQMLKADWVIAGRLTGHGHQHDPSISTLKNIIGMSNAAIFLKNNLKDIWGEPLVQEYPESAKEKTDVVL